MNLAGFLYGFGALQGVILAGILLAMRSGHRFANAIMAVLVVTMALTVLNRMLLHMGLWVEAPALALTIHPLSYTWGPLLYLYAFSLTGSPLQLRQLLHFLPAVLLFLAINIPFWQLTSMQQQDLVSYLWHLRNDPAQEALIWEFVPEYWRLLIDFQVNTLVFALQFSAYCLLLLVQLKGHNQRLQQHFSSIEHMNLRWLRVLTIAGLVFVGLFVVFNLLPMLLIEQFDRTAVQANTHIFFLIVLIYGIGIAALFQPSLIGGVLQARNSEPNPGVVTVATLEPTPSPTLNPGSEGTTSDKTVPASDESADPVSETETETETTGKYERSGLSVEAAQRYQFTLMEIMQQEKLYLDGDLTLPGLAEAAGLTTHQVSQVINGQMNQNFFSFVNNYRIQLAKRLLLDPKTSSMPIVELTFEVGFQSKSSFYEAFKKVTNMTPTQFKKSVPTISE